MWSRRAAVDYALARRATLRSLFEGQTTPADVCDAHPDLLRAARHYGEPAGETCPVCRREGLSHVTYVYGDELGQHSGRVKVTRQLPEMAREYSEFRVYVVEVCQGCAWNYLTLSYVLGTGESGPGRPRAAEE